MSFSKQKVRVGTKSSICGCIGGCFSNKVGMTLILDKYRAKVMFEIEIY